MAGRRCCAMATRRIRSPAPARWWSIFMRRASTRPTIRCGWAAAAMAKFKFPHILGRDFSGVVSVLGAGVTDLALGDAVFGVTDQASRAPMPKRSRSRRRSSPKSPIGSAMPRRPRWLLPVSPALWAIEDTAQLKRGRDHSDPGRRRAASPDSPCSWPNISAPR